MNHGTMSANSQDMHELVLDKMPKLTSVPGQSTPARTLHIGTGVKHTYNCLVVYVLDVVSKKHIFSKTNSPIETAKQCTKVIVSQ